MTLISAAILLLFVMDPFGGIPLFLAALKNVPESAWVRVVLRECAIAFFVLFFFMLAGNAVLQVLHLSQPALGIAGGIVLFLIALRMVFPSRHGVFGDVPDGEPFIVPLAIPLIAGPSAVATVMFLSSRWPEHINRWILALVLAQAVTTLVLSAGNWVAKRLGPRGLIAAERLTGLLLTALAVQMFLDGLTDYLTNLPG